MMEKRSAWSQFRPTLSARQRAVLTVCIEGSCKNDGENGNVPDLYILDTSAIAAFTDQEEGAAEVERLLDAARRDECQIEVCASSLMELYYIALQEKDDDEATKLIALVKAWPVRWVYPDERLLRQAGKIKAAYRLSVADARIAAVAKLRQAKLVHKDPELAALAAEVSLLALPFKKKTSRRVRRVHRAKEFGENN
jgi:predicted nucleic acid-binding protein